MSNGNGHASVLDIPCDFGGVSIGENTARLGVRITRDRLNINAADEIFCGHRLTGRVVLGHVDDSDGQSTLWEDVDVSVGGTFDVKRISVSRDQVNTGLTFSLADIDVGDLAKFSKGKGRLVVTTVAELPEDEHDDDLDEAPDTLRTNAPWRDVSLSTLFEGAVLKKLNAAGLETVGQLSDYTASDRRLNDIDGIGGVAAQKIEDRMMQFWAANPQEEPVGAGA
jgi:hypothetical protein